MMLRTLRKKENVVTLVDSEDETEEVAMNIKQEPSEKDTTVSNNQNIQIIMENDSRGRFVQTVADHLKEANLSKGAMLALQSKILATIADHIS